MTDVLKNKIEKCTTEKQLRSVLQKARIKIIKDDTKEVGCLSIWISERTRIYKPYKSRNFVVQTWTKIKFQYSGIPVFFDNFR